MAKGSKRKNLKEAEKRLTIVAKNLDAYEASGLKGSTDLWQVTKELSEVVNVFLMLLQDD